MASPAHLFVLGLVLSVIPGGLCYDLMPKPKECKNKIGDKKCEDLFNNKYNGKTYDMCFSYNGFDDCCAFCVDRLVCVNGNQNDLSDLKVKYMYLTVECKDTMKYSQCQNIYDNVYKKDTKAMCEDKKYSKMCCTFCRSGVGKAWNNRLIDEWIKHPYSAVDYFLGGKNDYNGYDKNGYYENKKDKSYGYDDYDGKADHYIKNMFGVFGYDDKDGYGYDYKGEYDNSKGDKGYDEHTETVFDFVKNMLDDIGLDGKGDYDDKIYGYDDKNDQGSYKSKGYRGYDDKDGNLDLNNLLDGYNSGETYGKDSDYTKGLLNDLGFGNLNNLIGDDYDLDKLVGNILKGSGYDDKKDYLRGTLSSRNTRKASSRRRREAEGDGVCKDTIGKDNCRQMMMNKYTVHGYGKYDKYDDRMDRSYNALGYDSYDDGDDSYIKDIFDGFDDGYRDDTGYNDNRNKEYGYDGYDDKIDDYIKNMFKGFGYDDKDDCGNSTGDYGYEDYGNKVYDYIKDMLGGFDFDGKGNYDDKSYGYGDENGKGNYDDKSYGYGDKNGKGVYGGKYYDRYGKSKYDDKKYVYGNEIGKGGYNGNSYRGYDGKGGYNGNVYRGYNDKNGYNDNNYRGYDDKSGYNGNDYRGYDGGYMDLKRLLDEFRYGGDYVKGLMDKLGMGNLNGLFGNDDYYNKFMKNAFKGSGYDGKKEYLRGNLASNDAGKTNKMDKISRRRRREIEGDGVCKDSIGKDNCRKMMMNKYTVHGGMPHIFCANPHNMVSCCRFCTTALADGEENRKRRSLAFQGKSEYPADGESEPCDGDSLGPGKCNQIVYSIFKGNKAGMCSTVHYGNVCCQSCRRYATLIA